MKLRLVAPLTLRGKVVMELPKDGPPARRAPLILSLAGGRIRGEGDLGFIAAVLANPDAKGDFIVQNAYPGVYRLGPLFQPLPPPYYLDSVQVGGADLAVQEVEVATDAAITVVYKTDGGTVSEPASASDRA